MKVFLIKFGESGRGGEGYTDDARIAAKDLAKAATLARQLSERYVKDSDASFERDKDSSVTENSQRAVWHENALKSWEPTSIIFESDLADEIK